jgi:hypothetical protein
MDDMVAVVPTYMIVFGINAVDRVGEKVIGVGAVNK